MYRASLLLLVFVLACDPPPSKAPRAFVSDERDGTVTVIDLEARAVVTTIPVGPRARGLRVSDSGMTLYVAHGGDDGGRVSVIDLESDEVLRRLHAGSDPGFVELVGVSVLTSNAASAGVALSDVTGGSVRATLATGPGMVASAPDDLAWVVSPSTRSIDVIDPAFAERVAQIEVGRGPNALVFSHHGDRAYVASTEDPGVAVIDVARREVASTIALDAPPRSLAISRDDKTIYVSTDAGLAVIDAAERRVVDLVAAPAARSLAVGTDGLVYAATPDGVRVIDPATRTEVALIPVGASPWAIVLER